MQAALAGLIKENGNRQLVSHVSIDRALSSLKTIYWAARSDPDRWTGYHVRAVSRPPDRGYQVRDGRITLDFSPTSTIPGALYVTRSGSPTLQPRSEDLVFDNRYGGPRRLGPTVLRARIREL